jgi:hypothetical protein
VTPRVHDIRNDSASPLPAGVSLDAVISSVTLSTDSTDPCAGTAKGTVKGDIVVVGDAGTANSAHFEFVMR